MRAIGGVKTEAAEVLVAFDVVVGEATVARAYWQGRRFDFSRE